MKGRAHARGTAGGNSMALGPGARPPRRPRSARPEFGRTVADPIAPGFPGGRRPTGRGRVRLSRAPVSRPDRWTRPPGFPGAGRTAGGSMGRPPRRSTMVATRFNSNDHRNWFDPGNDCQKVANMAVLDDDADTDHRRGVRRTPPAPPVIAEIPRRAWSRPLDTRAARGAPRLRPARAPPTCGPSRVPAVRPLPGGAETAAGATAPTTRSDRDRATLRAGLRSGFPAHLWPPALVAVARRLPSGHRRVPAPAAGPPSEPSGTLLAEIL